MAFYSRHHAFFFDKNGDYVGKKAIKTGFNKGNSKRTFVFNDGLYNINPKVSRSSFTPFPFFADHYFYFYEIGNPDPKHLDSKNEIRFRAEDYKECYDSKLLQDLNKVGSGGLPDWLNWKVVLVFVVIVGVAIYFLQGGKVS